MGEASGALILFFSDRASGLRGAGFVHVADPGVAFVFGVAVAALAFGHASLMRFERVFSKAPWEKSVGYCRALKAGNLIFVTGTAPVDESGDGVHAPGDPYAQAMRCFELIERALRGLGADRSHIVRTRMFVTRIEAWAEFGRAHGEFFRDHPPTTSMIGVSALIDPRMLIEIEADAVVAA